MYLIFRKVDVKICNTDTDAGSVREQFILTKRYYFT